ncbi:helix-turn-helix domain-containing protein [Sinorhizobium meliloti]|uniref:helix-turn-helix domain-containing protein n=1 Tax=Rhizobium meliloti TaxID=382 RepID=UPI001F39008A|nr:helix-turn-helix domain-containing protein [Sinorhizobium meliloti]
MSAKYDSKRTKTDVLIEEGTFNPTPEKVRDPKFRGSEFFDPHDAVQVKYEMLRRVSIDKVSVTEASDEYGVSRPTYYQAKVNFDMAGIAGLVPTKPGPRGPHKIDDKVVAFLQAQLAPGEPVRARELAKLLRQELDIELHPRSIERVLKKAAGKPCRDGGMPDPTVDHRVPVRGIAQGCSRRSAAAYSP